MPFFSTLKLKFVKIMSSNNFDTPWFYEEIIDINNENKFEFNKENLHHCKKF